MKPITSRPKPTKVITPEAPFIPPAGMKTTVDITEYIDITIDTEIPIPGTVLNSGDFETIPDEVFRSVGKCLVKALFDDRLSVVDQLEDRDLKPQDITLTARVDFDLVVVAQRPMTDKELRAAAKKFLEDERKREAAEQKKRAKDMEDLKKLLGQYPTQASVLLGDFLPKD